MGFGNYQVKKGNGIGSYNSQIKKINPALHRDKTKIYSLVNFTDTTSCLYKFEIYETRIEKHRLTE